MKKLAFLFAFLFVSFAGFSQNGVYIFGFLENGPGTPVNIHFEVNTVPSVDTVLTTNADGTINTTWLNLPNMDWNSIQSTFINCLGDQVTVVNNYSPNNLPIDANIVLNYCADDPIIFGCTDPFSISYNPTATVDDGSCEYLDCEAEIFAYTNEDCSVIEFALFAADTLSISSGYWTINGEEYYGFDSWITYDAPGPGTYEACFEGWSPYCSNGVFACAYIEVAPDCFETDCPEVSLDFSPNNCDVVVYLENIDPQETVSWYVNGEGPSAISGMWLYEFEEDGVYEFCAEYYQEGCDVAEYCATIDVWNCGAQLVLGCTDPDALNYNPLATIDDGSCVYSTAENDLCADALPLEIGTFIIDNSNAFNNEDVWGQCWGFGSGEGEQTSIWYSFTTPDEPAAIDIVAIADGTYTLTDTQFGLFTECGGEMIYCDGNSGEGLLSAFHFTCGELDENTEYILMIDGWYGDAGTCLLSYEVTTGCDSLIYGCMDPNATNYNPLANADDGSCQYFEDCEAYIVTTNSNCSTFVFCAYPLNSTELLPGAWSVNGEIFDTWNFVSQYAFDQAGVYEVCFETYSDFCDNPIFTCTTVVVEESCFETCPEMVIVPDSAGCGAWHYIVGDTGNEVYDWYFANNASATGPSGIYHEYESNGFYKACIAYEPTEYCQAEEICAYVEISGCGDVVFGCMNPDALNYNPDATIDDGSCIFESAENDLCAEALPLEIGTFVIDNSNAVINEDVWGECWASGSGEGEQTSIWFSFTTPDEPAAIDIIASSDGSGTLTDTQFGLFLECGGEMIQCDGNSAQGLFSAFHFECGDLAENTEYILMIDGYYGDSGTCLLSYDVTTGCDSIVYGCTDPNAINYNPNATVNDGSCTYWEDCWVYIDTDQLSCNTFVFYNYVESTGWPIDGDWYVNGEFYQSNATLLTFEATEPGVYDICFEGYSPECQDYSFSCIAVTVEEDCFDTTCPELYVEVDSCVLIMDLLNVNTNEWVQWYVNDEGPLNVSGGPWYYDLPENGAYTICAVYTQEGCDVSEFCTSIEVEGCEGTEIFGCTDPNAMNYNPDATINDGSCVYWEDCYVEIETDQINCSTFVFTNYVVNDGWPIDGDWYVNGMPYQWNGSVMTFEASESGTYDICFEAYLPNCEDYAFNCTLITVSEDCFGTSCPEMVIVPDSAGCGAWHYIEGGLENQVYTWYFDNNQTATGPSGIYHEYGGSGFYKACIAYEPNEYCDAGEICEYVEIVGCNEDVYGCMDSLAVNYNPLATIDDGTCIYGFECTIGFSMNINEDGTISIVPDDNILDAIEVLWTFGDGSSSNELFPVHQYEGEGPFTLCLYVYFEDEDGSMCEATFCVTLTTDMLEAAGIGADGFILSVTDITETLGVTSAFDDTEINIFPNPGNDIVNIKITTLQAEIFDLTIVDITGQIIYQETVNLSNGTGKTVLNVSNYATGLYVVSVRNSFGLLNKRFVVSR